MLINIIHKFSFEYLLSLYWNTISLDMNMLKLSWIVELLRIFLNIPMSLVFVSSFRFISQSVFREIVTDPLLLL